MLPLGLAREWLGRMEERDKRGGEKVGGEKFVPREEGGKGQERKKSRRENFRLPLFSSKGL